MRKRNRKKQKSSIDVTELYALKLSTLWAAYRMERISFWMLCIYFFFEYVRPQNIYPVLNVLPWGMMTLLLALITAFMDPRARWVSNVENRLLVLFTLIVFLSGVFSFLPSVALEYAPLFGTWVIAYFIAISVLNTEKKLLLFLLVYFVFNLKMSISGTVTWGMRGFSFASYGLVGSPGYFKNSGEFALQMLIFGTLATSLVYALKDHLSRRQKWFYFALAGTGYMVVLGASSRGSQLALLVVGVWFLLRQKDGLKGLLVMAVLAAILFHLLPDQQMDRFRDMGNDRDSLQRLEYWVFGLKEVIPKYPIIGVGYQNWLPYFNYLHPEGVGPLHTTQGVHNIYIQAAAELGLFGLLVFLLMIIYAFINNKRTRVMAKALDKPVLFNLTYGLDAGLIGYLVAGSFVTVLYYPYFWIQMLMIVALNNVTRLQYDEEFAVRKKSAMRTFGR